MEKGPIEKGAVKKSSTAPLFRLRQLASIG